MKKINVEYIDTTKYICKVTPDEYADDPSEYGSYSITVMTRRDMETINKYFKNEGIGANFKAKYQKLAEQKKVFLIDKYEHSGVIYSLHGEGMQCKWDTTSPCGVMELTDVDDMEPSEREQYARDCLKEYNSWINGEVYTIEITTENGAEVDYMSGIYDVDAEIEGILKDSPEQNITVEYL